MAQGMDQWRPYGEHVQGGLPDNNYISAKHVLLMVGPPFLRQVGVVPGGSAGKAANTVVYPLALSQGFNLGMNQATLRLFEIGSQRSYPFSGRAVGQASLSRPVYHGPSLLRSLYAYYDTAVDTAEGAFQVRPLMQTGGAGFKPFTDNGSRNAVRKAGLNTIRVPPGYDNLFVNLASDLFAQSFGFFVLMKDNELNNYGAFFIESCLVPNYSIGFDANGLLVQESASIQFERIQPVRLSQVGLVDTFNTEDETGGYNGPRLV